MPENNPQAKTDLGSLIGTKEILNLVVGKLSSQLLLFSIATIVLFLVSYSLWGEKGIIPTIAILVIFLIAAAGYLFVEQKQKVANEEPRTVNNLLGNKIKNISHEQSNFTGSSNELKIDLWAERADQEVNSSRDINISPVTAESAFKPGDKIIIKFRSSKNCYLTLLNIGTSGKLTILYPNQLHADNFIEGGKLYEIPGSEYGFEYKLSGPAGKEKLKAIVTESKINLVESQFTSEGSFFKTVSPSAAARDIVIIEKKIEEIPQDKWNEAYFEFSVAENKI